MKISIFTVSNFWRATLQKMEQWGLLAIFRSPDAPVIGAVGAILTAAALQFLETFLNYQAGGGIYAAP